jgi:hypothetical protein
MAIVFLLTGGSTVQWIRDKTGKYCEYQTSSAGKLITIERLVR